MKFDEAYHKMKEGKVMMVRDTAVEPKFYRIINDTVEVKNGYDGQFIETFIKINTFIQYDFIEEFEYTLDFIEAMKQLIKGYRIKNECTVCSYVIEDGELKCYRDDGSEEDNIWFPSNEIQAKWRVVE